MTGRASYSHDSQQLNSAESRLLHLLEDGRSYTLDELVTEAPEFSWAQLFIAMDHLNRSGMVELCRQGFSYWLRRVDLGSAVNVSYPYRR